MDYQKILEGIYLNIDPKKSDGHVASYIPELACIHPDKFGIHLCTVNGEDAMAGDSTEKFSIQSTTKVFSLALAYSLIGEKLWERVDVEPSGNPFNSLVQLEYEKGVPRNPLINAGALVVSDILISLLDNPKEDYLNFIHKLCGSNEAKYSEAVAESELKTGF